MLKEEELKMKQQNDEHIKEIENLKLKSEEEKHNFEVRMKDEQIKAENQKYVHEQELLKIQNERDKNNNEVNLKIKEMDQNYNIKFEELKHKMEESKQNLEKLQMK